MKIEDLDWWAQNPHNRYECKCCGQHYKCNDDPENVLKEECFRCKCNTWDFLDENEIIPAFKTWVDRQEWSKNKENLTPNK